MSTNPAMHREVFHLLCNNQIGKGMSRDVYDSKLLLDSVVKIEDYSGQFQNIIEWETWQRVKDTDYAKWFAPCEWISPNGSVLIQKKTQQAHKYPDKMPVFFCDFKRTNYGMHNGKFVCHDYGTNLLFENGMTKRLRKADWWDV
jgi:hypothetical protein